MQVLEQSRFLILTALTNILRHKTRSFLTILSIIVGVATVIATIGIGKGAQEKIRSRLTKMGINVLSLYAGSPHTHTKSKPLTTYDVTFLQALDPRIKRITGICRSKETTITYLTKSSSTPIIGADSELLLITNRKLATGRNFLASDMQTHAPVTIIGAAAAEALFKGSTPIGKLIFINNAPFKVIGVLAHQESPYTFYDINKEVYLPLTSWKRTFSSDPNILHNILISITHNSDMTEMERLIRRVMRARHQIEGSAPDDFTIWNQSSMMAAAEQSSQTLNLLLLIIASLSLLVGGLGVSNIMLVTVTERTKEIGIRMALGASPKMILTQFLIESIFLCVAGGIIGVILGIIIPYILTFFVHWSVIISIPSIIVSVASTSIIGLFFGYWPAHKASKLTIVAALHNQ